MTQTETLRLTVDSSSMDRGRRSLDTLRGSSVAAAAQADKLSSSFSAFGAVLSAIGFAAATRGITNLLEVATNINNKLRIVTDGTEGLNKAYEGLYDISQSTRTSLATNADLFNRLTLSTEQLDLSMEDTLDITRQLGRMIILSGESAESASGALRQLGQGLATGALRGDEFISVSENIVVLMRSIVDELNRTSAGAQYTIGDLRGMAAQGALTAELIVSAIQNAGDKLEQDFSKINATIGQSMLIARNSLINFARSFDGATNATGIISASIIGLSDNLGYLAGALSGVAVIAGGALLRALLAVNAAILASPIGRLVTVFLTLTTAIGGAVSAIREFQITNASFGQMVQAAFISARQSITGTTVSIRELTDQMGGASDELSGIASESQSITQRIGQTTIDIGRNVLNTLIGVSRAVAISVRETFMSIPASFDLAVRQLLVLTANAIEGTINGLSSGIASVLDLIGKIPGVGDDIGEAFRENTRFDIDTSASEQAILDLQARSEESSRAVSQAFQDAFNRDFLAEGGQAIQNFSENYRNNLANVVEASRVMSGEVANTDETLEDLSEQLGNAEDSLGDVAGAAGSASISFEGFVAKLREENELLIATGAQREIVTAQMRAQQEIARALTAEEAGIITALTEQAQAYRVQGEVLEEIRGPQEQLKARISGIHSLFASGRITLDEYNAKYREMYIQTLQGADDWGSGIKRAMFGIEDSIGSAADIAERSFTNAFDGMADALTQFITKGEFDFRQFTNSLVSEMVRLSLRMAMMNIFSGIMGGGSGLSIGGFSGGSKPIPKFAEGGVTSGGMPAILHPNEAVIPLSRNRKVPIEFNAGMNPQAGGGASPIINIINNSGGEVQTSERAGPQGEPIVDVIINRAKSEMASDIMQGGSSMNRALESKYGLNSAGSSQR